MSSERIAVGMSGGVDSSVTALLVRQMGHDVVGVTMRIYGGDLAAEAGAGMANACYGPDEQEDVEAARRVCAHLGIPFHEVDLRAEYRAVVLGYFRQEYRAGRTPNPCVRCNQFVKFGLLMDRLAGDTGLSFDRFATGHYARVSPDGAGGRFVLSKAADAAKDQSYFLCMLSQAQLGRALFPLGGLPKTEVRRIARENGLHVHDKPDSQNFAGGDYRRLLGDGGAADEGEIRSAGGEILGRHRGIGAFTIGQRRGLGIARGGPLYVTHIDRGTRTVFVGPESELYSPGLRTSRVNWVSIAPPGGPIRAGVRIRYQGREAAAAVAPEADGSARVLFDEPQRAIAAGQWAVFYDGDRLLGGGVIEGSEPGGG